MGFPFNATPMGCAQGLNVPCDVIDPADKPRDVGAR